MYVIAKQVHMKIIQVKRKSKVEKRYTKSMGQLAARVTYVKKYVLGIPIKTLHKYRETYYGEVKDCEDCELFI
tara:strand:+ start:1710 stop:1928 length:219 start_codon:yes stop_codon:yes gene_type:complete